MAATSSPNTHKPSIWAGSWYFVVTIISFGLLAWLPFVHAAHRLHRRSLVILAMVYAAAAAAVVVLLSLPVDAQGESPGGDAAAVIAGLLIPSIVIAACVQQALLLRKVFATPKGSPAETALAAALDARDRRAAARQIVANDPLLARDLRIGRPDLHHSYDDGGLIDLNGAPAPEIAHACGLSEPVAEAIVAERSTCGGFLAVDDVFSMTDVPVGTWDVIRDRGIVLPRLT